MAETERVRKSDKQQNYEEEPPELEMMDVEDEMLNTRQAEEIKQVNQDYEDSVDEDENLFELEIKNLDTNEVFKMHIPIGSGELDSSEQAKSTQNYASKRKHELTDAASPQTHVQQLSNRQLWQVRFVNDKI